MGALMATAFIVVAALGTTALTGHPGLCLTAAVLTGGLALLLTRGRVVVIRRRARRTGVSPAGMVAGRHPGAAHPDGTAVAVLDENEELPGPAVVVPPDELAPIPLDSRTAAAVTCGAVGLFLFNVVFGPIALALGISALSRGAPGRWGRAAGLSAVLLGAADLAVFIALLLARLHHGHVTWTGSA